MWTALHNVRIRPGGNSLYSNRNEKQEYFLADKGSRCVGLITLPPSCADCLEILEASTSWSPKVLYRVSFTQ